jgi:hypothetical protein
MTNSAMFRNMLHLKKGFGGVRERSALKRVFCCSLPVIFPGGISVAFLSGTGRHGLLDGSGGFSSGQEAGNGAGCKDTAPRGDGERF